MQLICLRVLLDLSVALAVQLYNWKYSIKEHRDGWYQRSYIHYTYTYACIFIYTYDHYFRYILARRRLQEEQTHLICVKKLRLTLKQ